MVLFSEISAFYYGIKGFIYLILFGNGLWAITRMLSLMTLNLGSPGQINIQCFFLVPTGQIRLRSFLS